MADIYAVRGRPAGRGRPRGPLLHAVPATDRTRTALCGLRVGGLRRPWPDGAPVLAGPGRTEPGTCPECAALLSRAAAA